MPDEQQRGTHMTILINADGCPGVSQRLDFYENRTGKDYIRVEYRDGCVTEDIYYFDWNWDNNTQTCIRMKYGPDDVSYFERIWMSDNTLSGLLDGTEVYFKGRY